MDADYKDLSVSQYIKQTVLELKSQLIETLVMQMQWKNDMLASCQKNLHSSGLYNYTAARALKYTSASTFFTPQNSLYSYHSFSFLTYIFHQFHLHFFTSHNVLFALFDLYLAVRWTAFVWLYKSSLSGWLIELINHAMLPMRWRRMMRKPSRHALCLNSYSGTFNRTTWSL